MTCVIKAGGPRVPLYFFNFFKPFFPCLCYLYNAKCAKMLPLHLGLGELWAKRAGNIVTAPTLHSSSREATYIISNNLCANIVSSVSAEATNLLPNYNFVFCSRQRERLNCTMRWADHIEGGLVIWGARGAEIFFSFGCSVFGLWRPPMQCIHYAKCWSWWKIFCQKKLRF